MGYVRLSKEDYQEKLIAVRGDRYSLVGEYTNVNVETEFKCNKCGNVFSAKPSYILYDDRTDNFCDKCIQTNRSLDFVNRVNAEFGNEFTVLDEYITCKHKLRIKHNDPECNSIFTITGDAFFNKSKGCPICNRKNGFKKLVVSNETFLDRIKRIHGNSITVLSEYKGYKEKVKIRHELCGREFYVLAGDLQQGKGCKYCAGKMLKTQEKFESEIRELYGEEYTVLGEYINAKTKIKVRHNKCGYEWMVPPDTLLGMRMCPSCNCSNSEREIENILLYNRIKYKRQYYFPDCKYVNILRFDFAIRDSHKNVKALIEYDGEFHFQRIKFKNQSDDEANKRLSEQKIKDDIKTDYCFKNSIPLLRISYLEKNSIFETLQQFFQNKLHISLVKPDIDILQSAKSKYMNVCDFIDALPTGIYKKSFILDQVGCDTLFAAMVKNQSFRKRIDKPCYRITMNNIEIIRDNDWSGYIKIGNENGFNDCYFRAINYFYSLPEGVTPRIRQHELFRITELKKSSGFISFLESYSIMLRRYKILKCVRPAA